MGKADKGWPQCRSRVAGGMTEGSREAERGAERGAESVAERVAGKGDEKVTDRRRERVARMLIECSQSAEQVRTFQSK